MRRGAISTISKQGTGIQAIKQLASKRGEIDSLPSKPLLI